MNGHACNQTSNRLTQHTLKFVCKIGIRMTNRKTKVNRRDSEYRETENEKKENLIFERVEIPNRKLKKR